jgi:hypothetical protein
VRDRAPPAPEIKTDVMQIMFDREMAF